MQFLPSLCALGKAGSGRPPGCPAPTGQPQEAFAAPCTDLGPSQLRAHMTASEVRRLKTLQTVLAAEKRDEGS